MPLIPSSSCSLWYFLDINLAKHLAISVLVLHSLPINYFTYFTSILFTSYLPLTSFHSSLPFSLPLTLPPPNTPPLYSCTPSSSSSTVEMHTGEPLFGGSDQADQMCRIGRSAKHPLSHSLTHSLTHSLCATLSLSLSLAHSLIHLLYATLSLSRSLTHWLTHRLTDSLCYALSLTYSLIRQLIDCTT